MKSSLWQGEGERRAALLAGESHLAGAFPGAGRGILHSIPRAEGIFLPQLLTFLSHTQAPEQLPLRFRAVTKLPPAFPRSSSFPSHAPLPLFLAVSQKSLPRAVPSPEQRRGRPWLAGMELWCFGAVFSTGSSSALPKASCGHATPKSLSQKLWKHPAEIQSSPGTPTGNKTDHFPRKFRWQGLLQLLPAAGTAGWGGGEQSRAEMMH